MTQRKKTSWRRVWFVGLWLLAAPGIVFAAYWFSSQPRTQFLHDFRGKPTPGAIRLFGPQAGRFIKSEPSGLRITLPKDRKEREPLGVTLTTALVGDFEVTASVEIVKADDPPAGTYGVGVQMTADETARIGRLSRPKGAEVVMWDQWTGDEKKPTFIGGSVVCIAKEVRLRIKRKGNMLSYLWAPVGTGDDF